MTGLPHTHGFPIARRVPWSMLGKFTWGFQSKARPQCLGPVDRTPFGGIYCRGRHVWRTLQCSFEVLESDALWHLRGAIGRDAQKSREFEA